jgi:hypothetical protein
MKLPKFHPLGLALVLAVAAPITTSAAVIENLSGGSGAAIGAYDPLGQSFTAIDTELVQIAFGFREMNPAAPNNPVTMTLYSGAGFGGPILGQVTSTLPAVLPTSPDYLLFGFNFVGISLAPGSVYTAAVSTTDGFKIGVAYSAFGNLYADGQPFSTGDQIFGSEADLVFRVTGRTPNGVPDASGLEIVGLALAGLAFMRRMNRR